MSALKKEQDMMFGVLNYRRNEYLSWHDGEMCFVNSLNLACCFTKNEAISLVKKMGYEYIVIDVSKILAPRNNNHG
jgi:hypothetical protein